MAATVTAVDAHRHDHARQLLGTAAATAAVTMRAMISRLDPELVRVCGYHLGWVDATGVATSAGGGRGLRPALAVAGARMIKAGAEVGGRCAAAVELVHNFTLVHDDVMDGDATRRGRPTVWAQFGVPTAVLAGDALLALAVAAVAEIDTPTRRGGSLLSETLLRVVCGQQQDLTFESRPFTGPEAVTVQEYLAMAAGKTGALLGCALALPAACTPVISSSVVAALYRAGRHLGVAYQAADDILGLWGNPAVTGKPVYSDLRAGKKTLPILTALAAPGRAGVDVAHALALIHPDQASESDLIAAVTAIAAAGGQQSTLAVVADERDRALHYLDAGITPTGDTTALRAIADYLLSRPS